MRRVSLYALILCPALASAQVINQGWKPESGFDFSSGAFGKTSTVSYPVRLGLNETGPILTEDSNTVSHVYWTPTVTNYALQSGSLCASPWGISAGTCTPNSGVAPDGTATMAQFTSSSPESASEYLYQFFTTASSTTFTASVWMAKNTGAGVTSVHLDFSSNASGCSCGGAVCTVVAFGTACQAKFLAVGATPVRGWVSGTGSAARTNPSMFIYPGEYAVLGGSSLLWGGQIETGLSAGTYTPTTVASASSGGLVETTPPSTVVTNWALRSETSCVANAVGAGWSVSGTPTCVSDATAAPDGTTTMDEWTNTTNTHYVSQTVTTPSSTTFVASAWMQKPSTGAATILVGNGTADASGCTCGTSDGSACTPTASSGYCVGTFTGIGTTPVRGWVGATKGATTAVILITVPGNYGASTGTTRFWGAQVETGLTTPSTYVPTTTTAVSKPFYTGTTPLAWTMNGTVPQVAANVSPFVPGKPGAGPFSAANSYSGPTTLGEWQGDFSVSVVWSQTVVGAQNLFGKMNAGATVGWLVQVQALGSVIGYFHDGALKSPNTINVISGVGPNIVTVGKSGGTCYVRLNGGASASTACGTMTSAAAEAIRIGRQGSSGSAATTSTIYEILASTTPYSDALHAARFNAVFGLLPGPVSVTRADPVTYTANGFVWSAPPATMGIGASGAEVWKGSTNGALQSGTLSSGSAAVAPWTLTSATVTTTTGGAPDGAGNWAEVTSTTNIGAIFQSVTTASSTTHAASVWAAKASGTGAATVALRGSGTVTGGTCSRSGSGSCTLRCGAATSAAALTDCEVLVTDLGTTAERLSVSLTGTATTAPVLILYPGQGGTATGTTRFWGAQVEPGLYPTPYIATTGTATARAATVSTVPLPALGNRWCVSVTATPGHGWGDVANTLWSNYAGALPNTSKIEVVVGEIQGRIWDSTGTERRVTWTHGLGTSRASKRITLCNNNGTPGMYADGVAVGSLSLAGTAIQTATLTPVTLGAQQGAGQFDGSLSNFKVCKGATSYAGCR